MFGLYQWKKASHAVFEEPNRSGKSDFKVLNWASEKGLSSETWGREWVLVTPRSAAQGLDFRGAAVGVQSQLP